MSVSVKNAVEYKGGINGLKFILGVALVVFAGELDTVQKLMPMFPDVAVLHTIAEGLQKGIDYLQYGLTVLGGGLSGIGFFDKLLKLFKLR